jgi:hypothetical protein
MVLGATEALGFIGCEKFNAGTIVENDFTVVAVPSLEHFIAAQNS